MYEDVEFEQFYAKNQGLVYDVANQYFFKLITKEEVLQELYIEMWKAWLEHDKEKGAFTTLFYTLGHNRCKNLLRKESKIKRQSDMDTANLDDLLGFGVKDSKLFVAEISSRLTFYQRRIVDAILDGYVRVKDLSEEFNVSVQEIKKELKAIKTALALELAS